MSGGRLPAGVVKVDTVRWSASMSSPFIARLLVHLAARGYGAVPRHLGADEHARDILTVIPGHVAAKWQHFTDRQVSATATLLRELNDASHDLAATLECLHLLAFNRHVDDLDGALRPTRTNHHDRPF